MADRPSEEDVTRIFFPDGRLSHIPAKRSKRLVVLQILSDEFRPGVRYPEREVNEILNHFHDDHAALRRWLVDEQFLARQDGFYWRTGSLPYPRTPDWLRRDPPISA